MHIYKAKLVNTLHNFCAIFFLPKYAKSDAGIMGPSKATTGHRTGHDTSPRSTTKMKTKTRRDRTMLCENQERIPKHGEAGKRRDETKRVGNSKSDLTHLARSTRASSSEILSKSSRRMMLLDETQNKTVKKLTNRDGSSKKKRAKEG